MSLAISEEHEALRATLGTPLAAVERTGYERDVAAVRGALGPAAFEAAWREGQIWPLEQVVSEIR